MISAETLRRWRQEKMSAHRQGCMTQSEAADRLCVPYRTYERWEREGCPNDMLGLALAAVQYDLPPYPIQP